MSSGRPVRVLIVGGGVAAAEAVLALRSVAEDRVSIEVVTPSRRLSLRSSATLAAFGSGDVPTFDLERLAADSGARVRTDRVIALSPRAHRVRLASGRVLEYDAALLALGARARQAIPGAMMFRDERDAPRIGRLSREIRDGEVRRLVVGVPPGAAWSLPAYELALRFSRLADDERLDAEVSIVTPEREPLEVFGPAAADEVSLLLRDHGVRLVTRSAPAHVDRSGLRLACGCRLPADRVLAMPALEGRRLTGVRTTARGFVRTDARGRVLGLPDVWAVGDMRSSPLKQGGLAAQEADVACADIAAGAGVAGLPTGPRVLRAALLGGRRPLFLRRELSDADSRPSADGDFAGDLAPWWPSAKVVGRHLTPWMAMQAGADTEVVA